jgi:hypothetical protein
MRFQVLMLSTALVMCINCSFARKFNKRLSLQLTPTFIHKNLVDRATEKNDIWSMGFGGRFKNHQQAFF